MIIYSVNTVTQQANLQGLVTRNATIAQPHNNFMMRENVNPVIKQI